MEAIDRYKKNENLVFYTIKTFFPDNIFDEDFAQVGRIGLWKACLLFDTNKGTSFYTYAVKSIRIQILYAIRDQGLLSLFEDKMHTSFNALTDKSHGLESFRTSSPRPEDSGLDVYDFIERQPYKIRRVLALSICGYKKITIAKMCDISPAMVTYTINKARDEWKKYCAA